MYNKDIYYRKYLSDYDGSECKSKLKIVTRQSKCLKIDALVNSNAKWIIIAERIRTLYKLFGPTPTLFIGRRYSNGNWLFTQLASHMTKDELVAAVIEFNLLNKKILANFFSSSASNKDLFLKFLFLAKQFPEIQKKCDYTELFFTAKAFDITFIALASDTDIFQNKELSQRAVTNAVEKEGPDFIFWVETTNFQVDYHKVNICSASRSAVESLVFTGKIETGSDYVTATICDNLEQNMICWNLYMRSSFDWLCDFLECTHLVIEKLKQRKKLGLLIAPHPLSFHAHITHGGDPLYDLFDFSCVNVMDIVYRMQYGVTHMYTDILQYCIDHGACLEYTEQDIPPLFFVASRTYGQDSVTLASWIRVLLKHARTNVNEAYSFKGTTYTILHWLLKCNPQCRVSEIVAPLIEAGFDLLSCEDPVGSVLNELALGSQQSATNMEEYLQLVGDRVQQLLQAKYCGETTLETLQNKEEKTEKDCEKIAILLRYMDKF
jgi:hypothetical protein